MKLRTLVAILLVLAVVAPSAALAQETPPCAVMGTAYLDGNPVSQGTVTVSIDSKQVASGVTGTNGNFYVQVGGEYQGQKMTFRVNGVRARETATWQTGATVSLDLHATRQTEVNVEDALEPIWDVVDKSIWTYNNKSKTWKQHFTGYQAMEVPDRFRFNTMKVGHGYWIYVTEHASLPWGTHTYELVKGWNLIGWVSGSSSSTEASLKTEITEDLTEAKAKGLSEVKNKVLSRMKDMPDLPGKETLFQDIRNANSPSEIKDILQEYRTNIQGMSALSLGIDYDKWIKILRVIAIIVQILTAIF